VAADEPEGVQIPVVWSGVEQAPMLYANSFLVQFDPEAPGAFILTIGQLTPPALIGTPEQIREQAEQISYVHVGVVARIVVTPTKLDELIAVLQANRDQYAQATTKMRGDPRDA
jgi:hypothetical protein